MGNGPKKNPFDFGVDLDKGANPELLGDCPWWRYVFY